MKIYIGTSGYSYKEWKGKFYPEKISPKEMLRFYSERLNSVEINNTFYHMPVESVLASWADQVPDNFLRLIPDNTPCAFEFRSPSWLGAEILDLLHKRGFSLCIADTDENPANE